MSMPKSLCKADDLVAQATTADPKDFSGLVNRVISLLEKEQKTKGTEQIYGKLVNLPPSGEAIIIGDLHGDLTSLIHILESSDFLSKAQKGENVHLIFLGDYGDRGSASVEVYYVVLKLKELFPDKVILMRGNHEGPYDMLAYPHDLPAQIKQKFGDAAGTRIYEELHKLFNLFYNAVLVDEYAILIHGGLPSGASSLEDLAYAHKTHPKETFLEEMLWSDPQEELSGTLPSLRGAGKYFGADVTERILKLLNVKVLIRGHEPSEEGYKINHNGKVLTLFSTNKPPYSNKYAAYLRIDLSKKTWSATQLKRHIKQFV
jgi:diadenosine tetraphosphatase ApaH/serine/threonine PP2A family protein phosphatase